MRKFRGLRNAKNRRRSFTSFRMTAHWQDDSALGREKVGCRGREVTQSVALNPLVDDLGVPKHRRGEQDGVYAVQHAAVAGE